jgi:formylglycine-generating enzyme required for sulfatase activity
VAVATAIVAVAVVVVVDAATINRLLPDNQFPGLFQIGKFFLSFVRELCRIIESSLMPVGHMTEESNRPLKVFICHAHSDSDVVRSLYQRLTRDNMDAWLDKEKLLPGQDWQLAIRKAVRESDVVIVCLSSNFNTAGFQQKEVRLALDTANEKFEEDIFIIPVRLEECGGPESLTRWHWVDLFAKDGYRQLRRALNARAEQIGALPPQKKSSATPVRIAKSKEESKPASVKTKPEISVERETLSTDIEAGHDAIGRDQTIQAGDESTAVQGDISGSIIGSGNIIHAQNVYISDPASVSQPKPKIGTPPAQDVKSKSKPETKKFIRKWNTQIVVAGIGALAVISAAALGSLPWKEWFAPAPTLPVETSKPAFTPAAMPLPTEITDTKGVSMRLIPAGTFTMGSDNGDADEQPAHNVYLDAYYVDTYEVTNAFYKICVDAGICYSPKNENRYSVFKYADYPVVYVDWNMSKTYCEWRGAELPTEAQWEKAARGTDGRTYPWGEGINPNRVNYNANAGGATAVGSYPGGVNLYGLYEIAGNVSEWVADWYQETFYQNSPLENPLGPDSGQYRVLRGGSWYDNSDLVSSVTRSKDEPSAFADYIGFRCARPAP